MTYDPHALHSSSTTNSKWPVLPIIGLANLALTSLKINTWCRLDRETSSVRNPLTSSLAPEMACSGATPAGTRIRWIPAVGVETSTENRKKLESPEWRAFVWWGCCLHWISSFLNSTGKMQLCNEKNHPTQGHSSIPLQILILRPRSSRRFLPVASHPRSANWISIYYND